MTEETKDPWFIEIRKRIQAVEDIEVTTLRNQNNASTLNKDFQNGDYEQAFAALKAERALEKAIIDAEFDLKESALAVGQRAALHGRRELAEFNRTNAAAKKLEALKWIKGNRPMPEEVLKLVTKVTPEKD